MDRLPNIHDRADQINRRRFLAVLTGSAMVWETFAQEKIMRVSAEQEESEMPELQTLMTGLVFPESPRWHDDRLWFADWGAQELIAVDLEGKSEVIVQRAVISLFHRLAARWAAADRLGE